MRAREKLSKYLSERISEIRRLKRKGKKVVGYTPGGYMPEELVYACDAIPIELVRGGDHEPTAVSGSYLPRFIDTFCRSQIGYRVLGEEPLYDMVDLVVIPQIDTSMKAVADCWDFYTDVGVFRFSIPHNKSDTAFKYYLDGIYLLREKLESLTGVKITDENLKEVIEKYNRVRKLLRETSLLRKSERSPISGREFVRLHHALAYADISAMEEILEHRYEELKQEQKDAPIKTPRLLLTASTLAMGDYKVLNLVGETGADIVVEHIDEGMKPYWSEVKCDTDPMQALAEMYFMERVPPASFRPSRERLDFIIKLARDFKVDGIIWYQLMYRSSYDLQSFYFAEILKKELNIPMLKVQSDYDIAEIAPLRTRVEAFIETLRRE